jgi:protein-S-isoprenylcysteine O-methyltransferase Ste14
VNKYIQAGKYLFRYRAAIAAIFFVLLLFFAKPTSSTIAHIFILVGFCLRLWAAGYLGTEARKVDFRADHRISNGPYRIVKHPLYIGNFLLVLGALILYNPPKWLASLYVIAFVIMYSLIAISERQFLRKKPEVRALYKLSNLKGEISTLTVVAAVYAIWLFLVFRE